MGHIVGKDIYRKLGRRLDQAPVRTPWTPVFRELVETLYSKPEASLVVRLPYRPSTLHRISRMLGEPEDALRPMIEGLCSRGWWSISGTAPSTSTWSVPLSSAFSSSP